MSDPMRSSEEPTGGWRLKLGTAILALSIVLPVVGVPLVASLSLSAGVTASASGGLLLSAEVMGVAAIAVMGKSGYAFIKNGILGFLKQYGPPSKVSRFRYRIGLVMFSVPLLFGWLSPYASRWVPGLSSHPFPLAIGGDILLLVSLFVLGGDFWDKTRSLFIHSAEARFAPL